MWVPVFFAAGIGVYFALPSEPPLWTAAAPFALLPLLWLFRRRPVVRGVVLLLLLATAGFADVQLKSFCLSRKAPPAEDGKLYLRGRIDRLDTNYRGRPRIVLGEMYDFEDNPVAGRYRLSMIHRDPGLEVGDCVEMVAAVSPPFPPSLADGYQFDRRLFFDGITGTGYIPSEVLPVKCPDSSPRLADRAAALIVLVVTPEALVGASFQMSFAAVFALVAFYEKYAGRLNRFLSGEEVSLPAKIGRGLFAYFAGTVIADLVASVATLPFGIYHFNQLDYYSSLTNLLSGPLIGFVIMPFVLVSLLAMPFGLEWLPLKIVGFGLSLTNRLTVWVASLPHATGGAVSMPVWALVLISLGGLWLCLWRGSWRIWGTAAVVVGMLAMAAVDKPDIIVDRQGKTMAVLNRRNGKYFFLPGASRWNKQNWLSKYAAEEEKNRRDIYNPLYPGRVEPVPGRGVLVDGRFFDRNETLGAGFYERDGHLRMETVRGYIGRRPWNR